MANTLVQKSYIVKKKIANFIKNHVFCHNNSNLFNSQKENSRAC